MPQMRGTARTAHFNAVHAVAEIIFLVDGFRRNGLKIARPPASRIIFARRIKQRRGTADTVINTGRRAAVVFPRERALGST